MRILHTADWHLGHHFYGNDRTPEHRHFLTWLLGVVRSQRPDAFLLVGDIFDNPNPSDETERLFWDFLEQLTRENPSMRVIITTGNHDSANRLEALCSIYRRLGIQIRTHINRKDNGDLSWEDLCIPIASIDNPSDNAVILAIPFLHANDCTNDKTPAEDMQLFYKKLVQSATKRFAGSPIVLMAHLFAKGSKVITNNGKECSVTEGPNVVNVSSFSSGASYLALGHLHKAQQVTNSSCAWYTGSVLPMNFAEKDLWHGINIVDIDTHGSAQIHHEEYKPLRQLITIPPEGEANINVITNLLSSFEKRSKNDNRDNYPFVEVKISEDSADTSITNKIVQEASLRQINLCRIEKNKTTENESNLSEMLQQLIPAVIVREIYSATYGEELTDEMAQKIAEVKRECEEKI